MAQTPTAGKPGDFIRDIAELRRRAREHLEAGAVTANYQGDAATTVRILNEAVATEIVCILRYKFHAVTAQGISSDSVKEEFIEHGKDEERHLDMLAQRINQLGGKPDMNPEGLAARSATQYVEGQNLIDMIRENLVAERIAVETYRDLIRFFGDRDSTTRAMLERILADEEDHANDMHDLLVAHEGRPPLKK